MSRELWVMGKPLPVINNIRCPHCLYMNVVTTGQLPDTVTYKVACWNCVREFEVEQ